MCKKLPMPPLIRDLRSLLLIVYLCINSLVKPRLFKITPVFPWTFNASDTSYYILHGSRHTIHVIK